MVRVLASILGMLASTAQALLPAPLHMRALQRLKTQTLQGTNRRAYEATVHLPPEVVEELQWWCDCLPHANGKKLVVAAPDVVIQTDLSKVNRSGWGATCGLQTAGGRWTRAGRQLHINALELKAATFGVQSFAKDLTRGHIVIQTDNAVTVAYINKMRGNNSRPLCSLAQDLWSWCIQRQLTVGAEYLPVH